MSIDLVAATLWLDLPPARKLVLLALCERANLSDGKCWPGREEIAARSSLTIRTVTPHLQALEADGWIRSGAKPTKAGQTTIRWVNAQRVLREGEAHRKAIQARRYADAGEESSFADAGEVPSTDAGEAGATVTAKEPSKLKNNQAVRSRQRYPRSDESNDDRAPDAKVELWLVEEMRKHFGPKVVAKYLADCELFFVWRKVKQMVDEGDHGPLKDLMPRAQAAYEAEVDQIAEAPADDDAERGVRLAIYQGVQAKQHADFERDFQEWEREHYPTVAQA